MTNDDQRSQDHIPTSYLVIAVALFLVGGTSGLVLADHQQSTSTFTGCLSDKTGQLYGLTSGDQPMDECRPGDSMIHLSGGDITAVRAGDGLESSLGEEEGDVNLSVDTARLDTRYRQRSEPPAEHGHDDDYVNEDEADHHLHDAEYLEDEVNSVTEFHIEDPLDADTLDGHTADDFLEHPSISNYEIVISETTHPSDTHYDILVERASCGFNQVVLGGGGTTQAPGAKVSMRPISPEIDPTTGYGWKASFEIKDDFNFDFETTAYAICATIDEDPH